MHVGRMAAMENRQSEITCVGGTFKLPSAMSRRRLQSLQKALVMEVIKDTLPLKPGTTKFFATSPDGSCKRMQFVSPEQAPNTSNHEVAIQD